MNFQQFEAEYERLLTRFLQYTPDQAGSRIYAEKLGELSDRFPEFMDQYDEANQ